MIGEFRPTASRPDEQIAAGIIPVELGGQGWSLSVLPIRANREWTALFAQALQAAASDFGGLASVDQFATALASKAEAMMDLLIAYDAIGAKALEQSTVLPEREWIDTHATDRECYEALKAVCAAAFPTGPDFLRIAPQLMPAILDALSRGVGMGIAGLSRLTSSQPRSTAGRRTRSNDA